MQCYGLPGGSFVSQRDRDPEGERQCACQALTAASTMPNQKCSKAGGWEWMDAGQLVKRAKLKPVLSETRVDDFLFINQNFLQNKESWGGGNGITLQVETAVDLILIKLHFQNGHYHNPATVSTIGNLVGTSGSIISDLTV